MPHLIHITNTSSGQVFLYSIAINLFWFMYIHFIAPDFTLRQHTENGLSKSKCSNALFISFVVCCFVLFLFGFFGFFVCIFRGILIFVGFFFPARTHDKCCFSVVFFSLCIKYNKPIVLTDSDTRKWPIRRCGDCTQLWRS